MLPAVMNVMCCPPPALRCCEFGMVWKWSKSVVVVGDMSVGPTRPPAKDALLQSAPSPLPLLFAVIAFSDATYESKRFTLVKATVWPTDPIGNCAAIAKPFRIAAASSERCRTPKFTPTVVLFRRCAGKFRLRLASSAAGTGEAAVAAVDVADGDGEEDEEEAPPPIPPPPPMLPLMMARLSMKTMGGGT